MDDKNFQLTSDPAAVNQVAKLQAELSGKMHSATVEMCSGITYTGVVSGTYFGTHSASGGPQRVGGYILLDTPDRRIRLDALDIKSWSLAS
jgi:hypothetical protein